MTNWSRPLALALMETLPLAHFRTVHDDNARSPVICACDFSDSAMKPLSAKVSLNYPKILPAHCLSSWRLEGESQWIKIASSYAALEVLVLGWTLPDCLGLLCCYQRSYLKNSFPRWHDKGWLLPNLTKHDDEIDTDDRYALHTNVAILNGVLRQRTFWENFCQIFSKHDAGCLPAFFRFVCLPLWPNYLYGVAISQTNECSLKFCLLVTLHANDVNRMINDSQELKVHPEMLSIYPHL